MRCWWEICFHNQELTHECAGVRSIQENLSVMAQEIWFRADLQNIIEGLAFSLAQSQSFSGSAQVSSYHHGFLSALTSIAACLGIANLEVTAIDRSIETLGIGKHVSVSDSHQLIRQNPTPSVDQSWPSTEPIVCFPLSH